MNKEFSLLDFVMIFLRRKREILIHFVVVSVLAVGISYLIPKKYLSTAVFLPPYDDLSTGSFSLGAVLNIGRSSAFTPQQLETILRSRRLQESVIREFDLIRVYENEDEPNPTEQTLKKLKRRTKLRATTLSGITQNTIVNYSLSVIDRDSVRAARMANFMVEELNRVMDTLSKNQYEYTRDFVKSRLDTVIENRGRLMRDFAEFQRVNKVYTPQIDRQIAASVTAYADLRQQRLRSEIQRDLYLLERGKESREVRFEEAKMRELDEQMRKLESSREPDVLPGLEHSVDLAQEFLKLYQEIEVLGKLELLLRQQYEEARIKSARVAPVVRTIDAAKPPEWKNSPKKAFVVLGIVGAYMTLMFLYILLSHGVSRASPETRRKLSDFREALRFRAR